MIPLEEEKRTLRQRMLRSLAELPPGETERAGEVVTLHLRPLLERIAHLRGGATVAFFASFPGEIDTGALDGELRRLRLARALPTLHQGELLFRIVGEGARVATLPPDTLGIPTPPEDRPEIALGECALVVVPGLAFDGEGGRLGRGKGYYDRALRRMRTHRNAPPAVAVALDLQRVLRVPRGGNDALVDALCTPREGLMAFRGALHGGRSGREPP